MTKNNIQLTSEVVECVNTLQTGGAELWNATIRRALNCVVGGEEYSNADDRLKIAQELLYLQDMMSTFITEGGAQ